MKIVVPCAGSSSRFPNMPPKWMLPDYDGSPMISKAVEGLRISPDDLIVTVLREHDEKFNAVEGLYRAFGQKIQCVVLDHPTSSQSETVAETLRQSGINEPFLVKDSDNYFKIDHIDDPFNYITVASLNDFDNINARNKSYVQVDQDGIVSNIREKRVISDLFSVGGYFFRSPSEFLDCYNELSAAGRHSGQELYLSEIIGYMILNGAVFKTKQAHHYQDWGTIREWRAKLEHKSVYLLSVDGFLFERGSLFFSPSFEQVKPNPIAIETALKMQSNHTLIYLSIRPPEMEELTRAQLRSQGLPDGQIIFGCGVAQWALVTSGHASLPFVTSRAFEVDPDSPNLAEKIDLVR